MTGKRHILSLTPIIPSYCVCGDLYTDHWNDAGKSECLYCECRSFTQHPEVDEIRHPVGAWKTVPTVDIPALVKRADDALPF